MSSKVEIKNKKAKFEYEFVESFTAGIQLFGTEIKSIRNSKASITESYAVMIKNELFIRNMYVGDYENSRLEIRVKEKLNLLFAVVRI